MSIKKFIEAATVQDSRNLFNKGEFVNFVPEILKSFYQNCDPIDVEVSIDGAIIHFVPIADLQYIQKEYSLGNEVFVFATCEGDPVFLKQGAVYTNAHGTLESDDEKLADSFDEYISKI